MFDNVLSKCSAIYRQDGNGAMLRQLYFKRGGTELTPGVIFYGADGPEFLALADDAYLQEVAIPEKTQASGTVGWAYVRGPVDNVVTPSLSMAAGDVFSIVGGAIADTTNVYTTNIEGFAVSLETTTSATSHAMWLFGNIVTKTT